MWYERAQFPHPLPTAGEGRPRATRQVSSFRDLQVTVGSRPATKFSDRKLAQQHAGRLAATPRWVNAHVSSQPFGFHFEVERDPKLRDGSWRPQFIAAELERPR